MTRLEHLERVTALTAQFAGEQNISPDEIYKFVDYANRRFWKTLVPTNPQDGRTKVTLNDGDLLPKDFTLWAGAANYVETTLAGPRVRSFHYVHPEQLGYELTNKVGGAKTYFPGLYFANMRCYTVPTGITAVTLYYFNRPVEMFSLTATDATDDLMPPWIAAAVHQDAAQALRILSDDTEASDQMLVQRKREEIEQNEKLFALLMKAMTDPVQQTVKGGNKGGVRQ